MTGAREIATTPLLHLIIEQRTTVVHVNIAINMVTFMEVTSKIVDRVIIWKKIENNSKAATMRTDEANPAATTLGTQTRLDTKGAVIMVITIETSIESTLFYHFDSIILHEKMIFY